MSYDILSSVSQNVLKFYQQLTGEERRIPFIFDLSRALIPTEASDNFDPMKTFVEPFILKKEGHLGFPVSIIV
jgi:hypothetical protein